MRSAIQSDPKTNCVYSSLDLRCSAAGDTFTGMNILIFEAIGNLMQRQYASTNGVIIVFRHHPMCTITLDVVIGIQVYAWYTFIYAFVLDWSYFKVELFLYIVMLKGWYGLRPETNVK